MSKFPFTIHCIFERHKVQLCQFIWSFIDRDIAIKHFNCLSWHGCHLGKPVELFGNFMCRLLWQGIIHYKLKVVLSIKRKKRTILNQYHSSNSISMGCFHCVTHSTGAIQFSNGACIYSVLMSLSKKRRAFNHLINLSLIPLTGSNETREW